MQLDLYLGFVLASTILILIPGPNVSLIVANSIAYGTRYGLLTVAGTSSAIVVQLALTSLGLTATLGVLAGWFEWIRWVGVAYLLFLGIRQWRAAPGNEPRQWSAQHPGQPDDRRVRKQVAQKWLDCLGTVRSTQVKQNDCQFHRLSFIRTILLKVMMKMM